MRRPALRWVRSRAGKHMMTTWLGDTQLTYVALRGEGGWVATRHVAGAGATVLGDPVRTLREAKAVTQADLDAGTL